MAHRHRAAEVGPAYEYCACGAVRRRFDPKDTWHVCALCCLPGAPVA